MKRYHFSIFISSLCFLFLLFSCEYDRTRSATKVSHHEQEASDLQIVEVEGSYLASLNPLNEKNIGQTKGSVEILIFNDDFTAKVIVGGSPRNVRHLQNIMLGKKCPTESDDLNQDGFIDFREALRVTGEKLIPLDSNLSDQLEGLSFGPVANSSGDYFYKRSAEMSQLIADLVSPDPDPTDFITKLGIGLPLNLDGRVILIHGASDEDTLPPTVSSTVEESAESLLPIACGKFVRL